MTFEDSLRTWLARSLAESIPEGVTAFSFNLFEYPETATVKFGVELVGCGCFDPANSDWACDEVWEPVKRAIEIPVSFSGRNWEVCQRKVRALIAEGLFADIRIGKALKSVQGVGLGFVDGDLEILGV